MKKLSILQLLPVSLLLSILPFYQDIVWSVLLFNIVVLISYLFYSQIKYQAVFSKLNLAKTSIPSLFKFLLIAINLLLISLNYGFHITQDISIVLLISMLCLKLLEISHEMDRRNISIVLYLQYFLIACSFLSSQGILITLYNILLVVFLNIIMMSFSRLPLYLHLSGLRQLGLINLKLAFIAIPLTLVLFLLFPRIPGPLWTLPNMSNKSTTGLSDTMVPGSVSSLSDSSEIVFRIDFKGDIPSASKLYWRGPVLVKTDGIVWEQNKTSEKKLSTQYSQLITEQADVIDYSITLEPQKQKWLFTLEMAETIESQFVKDAYLSENMQFLVKHAISRVVQYQARSYTSFGFKAASQHELNQALEYSVDKNPNTLELGRLWRKQLKDPQKIINQGLSYFVDNDFYYTRKPSLMINNPADEFLFSYKRGFCEHFASSFVLLMRAAGIPARVVTGYQGMEYNEVGAYYLVRQSNAHAWAEVWLQDKGWIRVDPTAVIPQDHIEEDIFDFKKDEMGFLNLNYSDLHQLSQKLKQQAWAERLFKQLKQSIDVLQYSWNNWILGYDQKKQKWLLDFLGFSSHWKTLGLLLPGFAVLMVALVYYFQLVKKQSKKDKLLSLYHKFLSKLNKQGLKFSNHSGPQALMLQSMDKFPQQAENLKKIFNYYIQLRYGKQSVHYSIKEFSRLVNSFSIVK